MFARYGIPKLLYSDGGPQYSSNAFKKFSRDWEFEHRMSSPEYPQSNGMAERSIQTVKRMLKKCKVDNKDPYLALLELRNTPIDEKIKSPAEIVFNRKPSGILPSFSPNKSTNNTDHYKEIKIKLKERQDKQKYYFDKGTRELPQLHKNNNVFF